MFTVSVCLSVCLWLCPQSWSCNTHHSFDPIVLNLHIHVGCGVLIVYNYFHNFRSQIKVVGHRKVGEININNFCIWNFGLWPIVSKIARGQRSDPLLKIRRIAFFAVSVYIRLHISIICNPIVQLIYMGYAACETVIHRTALVLYCFWRQLVWKWDINLHDVLLHTKQISWEYSCLQWVNIFILSILSFESLTISTKFLIWHAMTSQATICNTSHDMSGVISSNSVGFMTGCHG